MQMGADQLQDWLNFGHGLLIFIIFVMSAPWLHAYLIGLWLLKGVAAIRSLDLSDVITHWGLGKMADILLRHFEMYFPEWKCLNFKEDLILEPVPWCPNWQQHSIGSGNDTNTWTNIYQDPWCHFGITRLQWVSPSSGISIEFISEIILRACNLLCFVVVRRWSILPLSYWIRGYWAIDAALNDMTKLIPWTLMGSGVTEIEQSTSKLCAYQRYITLKLIIWRPLPSMGTST